MSTKKQTKDFLARHQQGLTNLVASSHPLTLNASKNPHAGNVDGIDARNYATLSAQPGGLAKARDVLEQNQQLQQLNINNGAIPSVQAQLNSAAMQSEVAKMLKLTQQSITPQMENNNLPSLK